MQKKKKKKKKQKQKNLIVSAYIATYKLILLYE